MEEKEKEVFEPMPEKTGEEIEEVQQQGPEALESEARRNMLYGVLWCIGGLAFSYISYYLTEAGGRYVVATGAIVWGAIQAIKGLAAYLQVKRALGDEASCKKAIAAAICTTAVIAGLGYASWRMVHAGEVRIVEEEQVYDVPELGLRVTIPAGFSEMETTKQEETETTYANYRLFTGDGTRVIVAEGTEDNLAEEVRTPDDIAEFLTEEAERYFDAGIAEGKIVEINGIRMLKHTGDRTQTPEWKTVMYDLVHDGSLITIYYSTLTTASLSEADEFMKNNVVLY